jgi:hypothetical protein
MSRAFLRATLTRSVLVAGSLIAASGTASADTIIDLTTAGSSGTGTAIIGGGFQVQQIDPQSTGTGVINPFLRIQGNGSEGGYNTDANPEYDAKAGTWTHALLLGAIPTVNLGGTLYRQFLLDINQNTGGSNEFLSLNQIQLFQSSADPGTSNETLIPATATAPPLISFAGANEIFRLNNPTDPNTEIRMNYDLNPGSGAGDMFLFVRNDAFTLGVPYVVMYSQFGAPPGPAGSNDGFEEWAVIGQQSIQEVPEPASLLLLGTGLAFSGYRARRRRIRQ